MYYQLLTNKKMFKDRALALSFYIEEIKTISNFLYKPLLDVDKR